MPFNGFGVFTRVYSWVADANAAIDINAPRMDTDTDDITTNGLGLCLTRDGQGSAAANLPMNGFKFTGLANGSAPADSAAFGQISGLAPLASPTFTGTVTGPDGGTWSSTGFNSVVSLGINKVAGHVVDIAGGDGQWAFTGTSALALMRFALSGGALGALGDAKDAISSGLSTTDLGLSANGSLYLNAASAKFISLNINASEKARFGSDGSFLVGSTTNAGAGAIGAAGNITAFYSDERLKTRIEPVKNALAKVMSLSAFYYHANDLAHEASGGIFDTSVREVGLSAQEVQAVLPEVVAPAPFNHEFLTLRYERIVALLVAAIQEQQAQIEMLHAENAAK